MRLRLAGLALAGVVVLVDLVTKPWILAEVRDAGGHITITSFFNLVEVWNRGVSFGMFQSESTGRWILAALSGAIAVALVVWLWRVKEIYLALALGLIIGGAIGNLYDRIWFGAVRDFLDFHLAGYHWPAFNVADAAIVGGVAVLLLDTFLRPNPPAKPDPRAKSGS